MNPANYSLALFAVSSFLGIACAAKTIDGGGLAASGHDLQAEAGPDAGAPPAAFPACQAPDGSRSPRAGCFDPNDVYAFGSTVGDYAVFRPENVSDLAQGFPSLAVEPIVRPTDGRLVLPTLDGHLVVYMNSTSAPTQLPDPPCGRFKLAGIFPDDGAILYSCAAGGYGILGSTDPVELSGWVPLALGTNREVLGGTGIPNLALVHHGVVMPVTGFSGPASVIAARSRPGGGFFVAGERTDKTRVLYAIDVAGRATELGSYDRGGDIMRVSNCKLESSGSLVCIQLIDAADPNVFGVVRQKIGTAPDVLYDQRTGPVLFYGHAPVTGP